MQRRYSLFSYMIVVITILGLTACTMNENIKQPSQSSVKKPKQFKSVLCKGYITKTGSHKPVEVTNKFIKGEDEAVFLFTKYFDVVPNAKYTPKWEWYGPNLELIKSTCIK